MRMMRQLGREDWIAAGMAALAKGGASAFRVEWVARELGVTKGSFYWHFQDRAAWRDAVLAWWEHHCFAQMVHLRRRPVPRGLEAALHAWGRQDVAVALCLQRIAAERRRLPVARLARVG